MSNQDNRPLILVGEDELEVRGYLEMALKCLGYEVALAQDGPEVIEYLEANPQRVAAVLLDVILPHRDGLEVLKEIRGICPDVPVIMVSGASSTMNVVTAMKQGAADFLCKPVAHDDLRNAVQKVLHEETVGHNRIQREDRSIPKRFLSNSAKMQEIQAQMTRIGWSEAPVLIEGETGSGKEVLARELHANSPRSGKIFLKLNCAALPSELVESELFGYERGAFTGAFQKKAGMFEIADGGTLLLDEIGDMDVRLQAKLLQVLQDQEFQRIGGKDVIKVNVRIIAATHRDLEKAISARTFREDLFYRLNVINIHVPPLRERREDILALSQELLKRHAGAGPPPPPITANLQSAMLAYNWPGNVRELENTMRKLVALRDTERIALELHMRMDRKPLESGGLPDRHAISMNGSDNSPIMEQVTKAKHQAETEAIRAALQFTNWNRRQAASLLKIEYKALLYKMKKLGIEDKYVSFVPSQSDERPKTARAGRG